MIDAVVGVDGAVLPGVAARARARVVARVVHAQRPVGARVEVFSAERNFLLAEFTCFC